MRRFVAACAIICMTSVSLGAQSVGPDDWIRSGLRLPSPQARQRVDWISTAVVAGSLSLPCLHNRTWKCLGNEGIQVGLGVGIAELTKRLAHRTRPDGSDRLSFFSEHTEIACLATANTRYWAICPAVGVARVMADRHWATDTAAGAFVGISIAKTVHWWE